ncbi:MAG TPA: beta-ketoacyl-[acyl-carrier-protein] synthase family protein [Thermoleophilaceae bacterium]|nr:beta-ketoacyl-[acyl-carrier-protein] synthase family protein [Thermoleophilaceae bacterium]
MSGIAITGIGLCTPVGKGTDETWSALMEGRSGIGPIEGYDASSLRTRIGAEVKDIRGRDYASNRRSVRTMTPHDVYAMAATRMALEDSGYELPEDDTDGRIALFTAGDKQVSDPDYFSDASVQARDGDGKVSMSRFGELAYGSVHPLFFIEGIQGSSLFYISEEYNLRGPNTYFSGTAEAGAFAVARGARALRRGEADVAIAGASDSPIFWWHMAAWDTLGVLTGRNELESGACAPYDSDRDGTVMGEGGAFFVLERTEDARSRGAEVHAEIAGFGAATELDYLASPDLDGTAVAKAVGRAIEQAGGAPGDVGYVAAHGAGTRDGDRSEAAGLRRLFGENGTAASSVKPATGHLVGAAGALNIAVAALALSRGEVPPTLNLENLDPDCAGLDWLPKEGREMQAELAVGIARGLEGQNVALALRRA